MRALITRFVAFLLSLFRARRNADWDTEGPPNKELPPAPFSKVLDSSYGVANEPQPVLSRLVSPSPIWEAGWWVRATRRPAHPGRVGGIIVPKAVVVHTTDMHPDQFGGLVKAWTERKGAGNCAHFLIGRTADKGVIQFMPIVRNGNHAGGSNGHGWFKSASGRMHPNAISVGIELEAAGKLKWNGTRWIHPDTGKAIPFDEVFRLGKQGFQTITPYQVEQLKDLVLALKACLLPLPAGTEVVPFGSYAENGVASWARAASPVVVGHVTLDPTNKTDPGPQGMDIVRGL